MRPFTPGIQAFATAFLFATAALANPNASEIHSLEAQQHLDYDVPIYDATFIGTHNSFSTSADGYSLAIQNQKKSISDQLDAGYRWLDIDAWHVYGVSMLCHGGCGAADTTLEEFLNKVNGWLERTDSNGNPLHAGEVIFISVQDEYIDSVGRDDFKDVVRHHDIWPLVYTKSDVPSGTYSYSRNKCMIFPMSLSKQDILDAGRQIVFLRWTFDDFDSRCDAKSDSDLFDVAFDLPMKNTAPQKNEGNITVRDGERGNISQFGIAADDRTGLSSRKDITGSELAELLERGTTVTLLDFGITDERHSSVTWSWAEGEPNSSPGVKNCAVMTPSTGHWYDAYCDDYSHRVACQSERSGFFAITSGSYLFVDADNACKEEFGDHYFFSVGVHAAANARLADAGNGTTDWVWINMKRHPAAGQAVTTYRADGSPHTYVVPEDRYVVGDYLRRGQSRDYFYMKDYTGGLVHNQCGGVCSNSGTGYAQSTNETNTNSWRRLWLIQTYLGGPLYYLGTDDNTVWEVGNDYVASNRQQLHVDDAGDRFNLWSSSAPSSPDSWPDGSAGSVSIWIFDEDANAVASTGQNYVGLVPAGSGQIFFFPFWN